jgi:hypothetical protein
LHLHQCPCKPICIFPHDQGKGYLTNNPVYALRQQGVDADDHLIKAADFSLTSACPMNGLVTARSALRP